MRVSRHHLVTNSIALLTLVAFGCTHDEGRTGSSSDSPGSGSACKPRGGERPAKAVLRCREASVAYIKNELGSGTGVVIALDKK